MREIIVEFSELGCSCCSGQWHVWHDGDWLASFSKKEDADQWAEIERTAGK